MTEKNDGLHPFVKAWREKRLAEVDELAKSVEPFDATDDNEEERWRNAAEMVVGKADRALRVAEDMAADHGFDPDLLARTIRPVAIDIPDIESLTAEIYKRMLLLRMVSRAKLGGSVRSKNLTPPSLLNYLLSRLVMNCSAQGIPLPFSLSNAVCEGLGVDGFGENEVRKLEEKCFAALLEALDETIGVRELARQVGVTPPTVTQWRKDPGYKAAVDRLRERDDEAEQATARAIRGEPPEIRFA